MANRTTGGNILKIELASAVAPVFKEVKGKDWVLYGEDNLYPDYLLYLLQGSSKHNAVIKGKVDYCIGGGVDIEYNGTIAQKAESVNLMNAISGGEDFNEQLKKVSYDYEVFNGFAIEVIPSNNGGIGSVNHIDFSKLRLSKDGKGVYYSNDWSQYNQGEKTGFKVLPLFSEANKKGIVYYRNYSPSLSFYPLPEYVGSINYIDIDRRISNWHLNNIANGFAAGTLINFATGEPTKDEKIDIEKRIKGKFSGDDNAGQIIITFSNGADRAPQVLSLQPNNFDKLFHELNLTAQQEIFSGHRITSPMLFGIKTEGQLGGRSELAVAHELFMVQYVNGRQDNLVAPYNHVFKTFGLSFSISIKSKSLVKEPLSENALMQILTRDELRAIAGYSASADIKMSNTDKVLAKLSMCGVDASHYSVVKSLGFVDSLHMASIGELRYLKSKFSDDTEARILGLLKENNIIGLGEIASALRISIAEANDSITSLFDKGLIEGKVGFEIKITSKGSEIITESGQTEVLEVKYRYAVRPDKGAPIIKGTRSFCSELINMGRLYSKEEINSSVNDQGTSAWSYRGGWYHDPQKDVNVPYCRHVWEQVLVKREI